MEAEGVVFHYGAHVGVSLPVERVTEGFDAVVLTGGAEASRDLPIPGRELDGIHFAMDYLPQQNRRIAGEPAGDMPPISAARKHVVVIGGGDTGSDCIGTAIRQGALSVTNFEIMPKPPEKEDKLLTWPNWPLEAAHLVEPRGRRRARLRRDDAEIHRPARAGAEARMRALRRQVQADPRHRVRPEGRPGAARHGLRASGARGDGEDARARRSISAAT